MKYWFVVMAAVLAACGAPSTASNPIATPVITKGSHIDPPRPLHDFTLASTTGGELRLSDLRGQPTMIFFGYTHCPDVCPTTLVDFRDAKELLGDEGKHVHWIFISVDGARDTQEKLKTYVGNFDPDFIGLTGDEAVLRRIGADYGLFFEKREVKGTVSGYLVDHTAASYLVDAEGNLRVLFPFGTPPEVYAAEIRALADD